MQKKKRKDYLLSPMNFLTLKINTNKETTRLNLNLTGRKTKFRNCRNSLKNRKLNRMNLLIMSTNLNLNLAKTKWNSNSKRRNLLKNKATSKISKLIFRTWRLIYKINLLLPTPPSPIWKPMRRVSMRKFRSSNLMESKTDRVWRNTKKT